MKVRIIKKFSNSLLASGNKISFVNFASLGSVLSRSDDDISYFCDGMLMVALVRILKGGDVQRVSFDFTSIADNVFQLCSERFLRIYFVGASKDENELFTSKIGARYPRLEICGSQHGYFDEHSMNNIFSNIVSSRADVVIVGLGAGKQEFFMHLLHQNGFNGVSFSCGGFIRQESTSKKDYYPYFIDKLSLRVFYRMYKEPHTIKRYLIDYPKNLFNLLKMISQGKVELHVD